MTVVNTHDALCLLGVSTKSAIQMQTDAMTIGDISLHINRWRGALTVDWSKPQNNAMQPLGRERADSAKTTQDEDCEKHRLMRVTAVSSQYV